MQLVHLNRAAVVCINTNWRSSRVSGVNCWNRHKQWSNKQSNKLIHIFYQCYPSNSPRESEKNVQLALFIYKTCGRQFVDKLVDLSTKNVKIYIRHKVVWSTKNGRPDDYNSLPSVVLVNERKQVLSKQFKKRFQKVFKKVQAVLRSLCTITTVSLG